MNIENLRKNDEKYNEILNINIDDIVSEIVGYDCQNYHFKFQELYLFEKDNKNYNLASAYLLLTDVLSMGNYSAEYSLELSPLFSSPEGRTAIIDDFTDDDLNCFEKLIDKLNNFFIKARLSDVLWKRKKHNNFGKIASENYFEITKIILNSDKKYLAKNPIVSCVKISKIINENDLNTSIIQYLIKFINDNKEKEEYFIIDKIIKFFIEEKHGNLIDLINPLENLIQLSENNNKFEMAISRNDLLIRIYEINKNIELKRKHQFISIQILKKYSFKLEKSKDFFTASTILIEAYERLKKIADSKEYRERLNDKIVELQMKSKDSFPYQSIKTDISDLVNLSIEHVKGLEIKEVLNKFAFVINFKEIELLKKDVIENIKNSAFIHFTTQIITDEKGRKVADVPNIDFKNFDTESDSFKSHMIQNSVLMANLNSKSILFPIFQTILNEHYIDITTLMNFVNYNPFIPDDRQDIFLKGFKYCFKNDFTTGMSILIPQFEYLIKNLLKINGINISTFNKNGRTQEDRMLSELFHDFKKELKIIIGEGLFFEINHIFNEKASFNIRNNFCHGNMGKNELNSYHTFYAFWLMWRICAMGKFIYNNKSK